MRRIEFLKEQVIQGYNELLELIINNAPIDDIMEYEKLVSNRLLNYRLEVRLNEIRRKKNETIS